MKILISLHGVRSKQKDNWQDDLDKYIKDSGRTDIKHIPYKYGWIPAYFVIFPFIRKYYIRRFRKWLERQDLTGKIYITAHSFGTYISFHALRNGLGAKTLILFGGILHCREDFDGIIPDQIKEIQNFHSLEDEVCKFNPLGHSGHYGFRNKNSTRKKWHRKPYKNKKVTNHRLFLTEHVDYFPSKFSNILKLL